MTEKLLDIDAAARLLGRTPHAVYRLVARRRVPHRKDGRRLFFLESELQEFIDTLPGLTLEQMLSRERTVR
jgi:hypothetical protein